MRIPLIRPYLPAEAKQLVCEVLDSGYLVEGRMTARLEQQAAAYLQVAHAVAVDSCTTGLEIALRCLGIGPGDEVVTADYTFPATLQAVLRIGATAVVVDSEPRSMHMDLAAAEAAVTPATRALMPVSTFGNPLDYDRLAALKQRHGLFVVEDAACTFGAAYRGRRVGGQADIACFSLHPRKFVTTARGGMNATDNAQWAAWMRSYKCFGKGAQATRADTVFAQDGANAMLPDVLSAIGVAQMAVADAMLARRLELADRYRELLDGVPGIAFPETPVGGTHAQQSFCVFVDGRDRIMAALRDQGIEAQIGTYAMHMHPAFRDNPLVRFTSDMAGSRWAFDHCLTLPLYHEMTAAEQDEVAEKLKVLVASSASPLRAAAAEPASSVRPEEAPDRAAIRRHWTEVARQPVRDGRKGTAPDHHLQHCIESVLLRHIQPGDRVLDVGCGDGTTTRILAGRAASVVGVDYIPAFVELARQGGGGNVSYRQGDVCALSALGLPAFDVVCSVRCLINLPSEDEQRQALSGIADALRPGGLYLAAEGWSDGMRELNARRTACGLRPIPIVRHNRFMDRAWFEHSAQPCFEVVRYVSLGMYAFLSRVAHPVLIAPQPPKYDHPLNAAAVRMQDALAEWNDFRDCDYAGVYVLRRR